MLSNSKLGKASSAHLISCKQAMSGEAALSQVCAASMRALMPLMFQVAIFMGCVSHRAVMPGLDPGIHAVTPQPAEAPVEWISGGSPPMTTRGVKEGAEP